MSAPATAGAVPTTENCRFCWMCRHVCPVGLVTSRETLTPHAWALTIESVRRGQLQWNAETVDVMFSCADCGLCRAHCVTDQPLPEAIVSARREIVDCGAAPAAVLEVARRLRQQAAAPVSEKTSADYGAGPVALFVGDSPGNDAEAAVDAALKLLASAGIVARLVGRGRSSGLLASTLGLRDLGASLAHDVVRAVQSAGVSEVLVLSAADRWTFEHVYPNRLGVAWPDGVRVVEVADVLAGALADGSLAFTPGPPIAIYAYHDPCHGPRMNRDGRAARALLAAIAAPGSAREMFWREGRAHPCGAIGGLELTQPAIAAELAGARVADARAAGAALLVADDPSCVAHLSAHADGSLQVASLYELLAERIA